MIALNKQGPADHEYLAGIDGNAVMVFAKSQAEARQRAFEHFKPKKKEVPSLWTKLYALNSGVTMVHPEVAV
jgi:hypothetical protein